MVKVEPSELNSNVNNPSSNRVNVIHSNQLPISSSPSSSSSLSSTSNSIRPQVDLVNIHRSLASSPLLPSPQSLRASISSRDSLLRLAPKPFNNLSEPVYSTPNSDRLSPASMTPPTSDPTSTASSIKINPALLQTIDIGPIKKILFDHENILAAASSNLTQTSSSSSLAYIISSQSSSPASVIHHLTLLNEEEKELLNAKKELEEKSRELTVKQEKLLQKRILLCQQIANCFETTTSSTTTVITPNSLNNQPNKMSTTTIEELAPNKNSANLVNESSTTPKQTASTLKSTPPAQPTFIPKKKPGPASKTGEVQANLSPVTRSKSAIKPTSVPTKRSAQDEACKEEPAKKQMTAGVKQSRPWPMRARARKRTSPILPRGYIQATNNNPPSTPVNNQPNQANNIKILEAAKSADSDEDTASDATTGVVCSDDEGDDTGNHSDSNIFSELGYLETENHSATEGKKDRKQSDANQNCTNLPEVRIKQEMQKPSNLTKQPQQQQQPQPQPTIRIKQEKDKTETRLKNVETNEEPNTVKQKKAQQPKSTQQSSRNVQTSVIINVKEEARIAARNSNQSSSATLSPQAIAEIEKAKKDSSHSQPETAKTVNIKKEKQPN